MREEMEHASMLLEWIRRNNTDFAGHLKTYLFTKAPIVNVEKIAEGKVAGPGLGGPSSGGPSSGGLASGGGPISSGDDGFTIGTLKGKRD